MKRRILSLTILVLQLLICSLPAITKKDAQVMVEGRRYTEAIEALRSLMSQSAYAKDADCNKWLGQSLCLTGQYSDALPYLEYAIRQNRKSGAQWYLAITRQHLYDFEGALEALETYRPVLKSDFWISRADSLEAEIQQGLRSFEHVEDIVIVDSLLVPRATFFSSYALGPESGRVMSGANGLFFENQAADYRIYAIDNHLYQSHKIQGKWEDCELLSGLGSEEFQIVDPFMRTDGETLYFACDSTPGLGGLDIYKTKFNAEEGTFYQPERLGMPFNSPFDDYMLAIDETHQIGWWATDRRQDPDNVVIYLFQLTDDPDYLDEATVSRARIDCIAETWEDENGYPELRASALNGVQEDVAAERLSIIINDRKVYAQEEQFASSEALAIFRQSEAKKAELDIAETQLAELRVRYAQSDAAGRSQLSKQILQLESSLHELKSEYKALVKQYRNKELGL